MSVMKRLAQESKRQRLKIRGSAQGFMRLSTTDWINNDLLEKLPVSLAERVLKEAVRKAGRVVIETAKPKQRTGKDMWGYQDADGEWHYFPEGSGSLKSKAQRARDEQRKYSLKKSIGQRVRRYGLLGLSVVGMRTPAPHAHLFEFGHRKVLWGRPPKRGSSHVEGKARGEQTLMKRVLDQKEEAIKRIIANHIKRHLNDA